MIEYSVKMLDGSRHDFKVEYDTSIEIGAESGKWMILGDGKNMEYLNTNMIVSIRKKEID